MYTNNDIEFIDFIDLINTTLSNEFIEKWRHNITQLSEHSLYNYLTKKCKYSPEQVDNFFEAIDIELYRPLIQISKKVKR